MVAGKIRFIGFQSLFIGRSSAYGFQNARILVKEATVAGKRFPRDIASLTLALLTLRRSLKLLRTATETRYRGGGSLLMQVKTFAEKERRCTLEAYECIHGRSNATIEYVDVRAGKFLHSQ